MAVGFGWGRVRGLNAGLLWAMVKDCAVKKHPGGGEWESEKGCLCIPYHGIATSWRSSREGK